MLMFSNLKLQLFTLLDQTRCPVNQSKRMIAYLIDWFLGALCMMLPLCLGWMFLTHDQENMVHVNVFKLADASSLTTALILGGLGLLLAFFYYVWVPYKIYPGQTVGKKTMGIQIEKTDGSSLRFKDLLLRQGLGLLVLEGVLFNPSRLWQDMISLASGLNFSGYLLYLSIAITLVSGLIAFSAPSRRMLHDYLAGTTEKEVALKGRDQSI